MAIWDSFTINDTTKTIRWTGPDPTIYTSNALYSWIQDEFDDADRMDEPVPMGALTPVEYTMINGWYIDAETTKYLKTGSVKSVGWTHPANTTGIRVLQFIGAGYVNCIATDLGKPVVGGATTDSGLLLHYDNTTKKWWIRCDAVGDLFDAAEAITITGGTGAGTTSGASVSGEEIWANLYSLGTIVAGTTIDIFQGRDKLTAWWAAGHIDVLVRIKVGGVELDSGYLWVFARNWTDLFDNFTIDATAGGRNAIPLSTADDMNNQTIVDTVADHNDIIVSFVNGTLNYDGGAGAGLVANKVVWDQTSNATAVALAIDAIVAGTLTLGNVDGAFGNNNTISELAELSFNTQLDLFEVGLVVTGSATGHTGRIRRIIQDPQGDGTVGKLYLSDTTGIFQNNEDLTDTGVGSAKATGTLTAAPTWTASVDGALVSAHTMTKDLDNGSGLQPYDVIVECNNHPLSEVYEFLKFLTRTTSTNLLSRVEAGIVVPITGEQYDIAYTGYTPVKPAPFGTLAGVSFFGAQGVFLNGMYDSDRLNFSLIDSNGVTQNPPNTQDVSVTGVVAGYQVAVFLLDGVGGAIDIDMCGGCAATPAGSDFLNVGGPIPTDIPDSGTIRVYDATAGTWQIYTYAAWLGTQFTGLAPVTVDAYTIADTLYVPFIDETAAAATATVRIIQSVVRPVLVRVRKKGILPFEVESSITATGMSVAAICVPDTIVT